MAKKYYSKRYTRKRSTKRTKYLIIGLILIFVTLVVVSAYTDIPQLDPIRKQMDSFRFKIQPQNFTKTPTHFERTTIEDIVTNPEKYIGKKVTVEGHLDFSKDFPFVTEEGKSVSWNLVDEQNYHITLAPPLPYQDSRIYAWDETYKVKGRIVYLKICNPFRRVESKMVLAVKPTEMIKLADAPSIWQ